jgi:hypothetical protein
MITRLTPSTHLGCTRDPPAEHRRRRQITADVATGAAGWISVADQKWGFEGVLWYQGMSRVCPGCPQSTPRQVGEGSCIPKAYGQYATSNLEPRTLNLERPGKAPPWGECGMAGGTLGAAIAEWGSHRLDRFHAVCFPAAVALTHFQSNPPLNQFPVTACQPPFPRHLPPPP